LTPGKNGKINLNEMKKKPAKLCKLQTKEERREEANGISIILLIGGILILVVLSFFVYLT
jgi:hypothetical protein